MKKAFSLIELVVTIVVVAIVSLAVPNVIKQISTSNARSLTQESILNAKTYLGLIMQSLYSCEGLNSNSTAGDIPFLYPSTQYGNNTDYADAIGIRRRFSSIRKQLPVTNLSSMTKKCNGIMNATIIDEYNGATPDVTVGGGIERDFIVNAVYTTQISTGDTDSTIRLGEIFNFGNTTATEFNNFNDVKIAKVNVNATGAQEQTQINLYGFTFNLGAPPKGVISTWN